LQYRRFYERENVRPYKILKALQFLTTHKTLWREAGVNLCPEFAAALGSEVQEERSLPMESVEISSLFKEKIAHSDGDESSEDAAADAHAFGNEMLVGDGVADPEVRDEIIIVAPGEDQHPLCLYLDKNAEEMANLDIFGGSARPTNRYSYKQLCRVELRHYKRWAACRPCNIFFKIRKLQVFDMKQLSWVWLRKSKLQGKPLHQAVGS
jgi:hypothetical protein